MDGVNYFGPPFPHSRVVPGDRRESRDPCLNFLKQGSGMDPGSTPLRGLSGMTPLDFIEVGNAPFTSP